jgi:hypothetical protein
MGDIFLRKYGVAATVDFALYKLDGTGLKTDASSASGDVTLYRDEAAVETLDADAFTDEGAVYSLTLSATEMQASRIIVAIVDQSNPQVWLDKTLIVETYGNASAQHAFDLDTATQSVTVSDKTGFSLSAAGVDAILDEEIDANAPANADSLRETVNVIAAATAGKLSGAGTNTLTFRDLGDTKARITATMDANNNRTAVTQDGT